MKERFKTFINKITGFIKSVYHSFLEILEFTIILWVTFNYELFMTFLSKKFVSLKVSSFFLPKLNWLMAKTEMAFDSKRVDSIGRRELIRVAIKNMLAKKTRTFITIGGMSLGIGVIVFLVSVGYGLQNLVLSRVVRLEEMRQADVMVQPGSKMFIDDKTLAMAKAKENIKSVLPVIAVVGQVNYQNSVTDVAVYGVTTEYLKNSAIKPVEGKVFESDALVLASNTDYRLQEVAGVADENIAKEIEFSILPNEWVRVRNLPSKSGKVLGFTKRREGRQLGVLEDGWVKSKYDLWKQKNCKKENIDCYDGNYILLKDSDGTQTQTEGYVSETTLSVTSTFKPYREVLGAADFGEVLAASDEAGINWIEIASEAGVIAPPETKKVNLSPQAIKEAVVNRALIKVLNIKEAEAVGKTIEVSFVVTSDLLTEAKEKVESVPETYKIVGVTPDEKSPVFFVPFVDLRSLGITKYSQMKISVNDKDVLSKARREIEAMGFTTRSVADTVVQINNLFGTIRTVLALLGMVALAVASLGMFNTLTVSLLERTREVGLMKAMGMRSEEIKELFLTESMIMGVLGGIGGIAFGMLIGKILAVILSAIAITKGVGFIDITSLPLVFVTAIMSLSVFVGVVTGLYPAHRATKISALNALRYE